jgi:hypothetical protein
VWAALADSERCTCLCDRAASQALGVKSLTAKCTSRAHFHVGSLLVGHLSKTTMVHQGETAGLAVAVWLVGSSLQQGALGLRVLVDLNLATRADVSLVSTSAAFAVNGSWIITGNSPAVTAPEWQAAMANLGSGGHGGGLVVSEDNPTATIECRAVRALARGSLNATFQ